MPHFSDPDLLNVKKRYPIRDTTSTTAAQDIDDNFDHLSRALQTIKEMLAELQEAVDAVSPGIEGPEGKTILGPEGEQGSWGFPGPPGPTGATGLQGPAIPGLDGQDGSDIWSVPNTSSGGSTTPGGSDTQVQFNDSSAFGGDAGLTYNKTTDALTLAGQLIISGAAAGQIVFPATQNSSSNANTLDDYEEGTWTPVIGGDGGTSGQTYTVQSGRYTKIGRVVVAQWTTVLSNKGTITGGVEIQGLPFTLGGGGTDFSFATIAWENLATSYVYMTARGAGTTSVIRVFGATAATTSAVGTQLVTADIANNSNISGFMVYQV